MRTIKAAGWLLALASALMLVGCGDQPAAAVLDVPAAMQVMGGDGQSGMPGTELPDALSVRLTNAQGHPLAGRLVVFKVTAGGGSMYAGASITDQAGVARDRWTVGTVTGSTQKVEARAVDTATGERLLYATFTAHVTAGPPASMVNALDAPLTGAVGYPARDSAVVLVTDAQHNPIPGVKVSWAVVSGGGRLPTTSDGTSVTNAEGKAHMWWVMGTTTTLNELRATVPGVAPVTFAVTPIPGSATSIDATPDTTRVDALGTFPHSITVDGVDRYGNRFPVSSVWTVLDTSVVRLRYGSFTAHSDGTARMAVRYNSLADTVTFVVDQVVTKVEISVGTRTHFFPGETFAPAFKFLDKHNFQVNNPGAAFSSSNPSVATVNSTTGAFTGVSPGYFQLTVHVDGKVFGRVLEVRSP